SVDLGAGESKLALGHSFAVTNSISAGMEQTGQQTFTQWFRNMRVPEATAKKWVPNARQMQYEVDRVQEIDQQFLGSVLTTSTENVVIKSPAPGGVWQDAPFDPGKCK